MKNSYFIALSFCLVGCAQDVAVSNKDGDIANAYYKNAIEQQRLEKVFELYARSAELGNPIAQYNLAMMYSNGESVYVDYQQAVYWFRKSAQQEFAPAQYRLGELYYFETGGLPRDLDKAIALFQKAATQKDVDAQMNLAMLAGTGEGLPYNKDEAMSWLFKARMGGNPMAHDYQKMLSVSEEGKFSAEQQNQYWIEKAAELGIRETQEALNSVQSGAGD